MTLPKPASPYRMSYPPSEETLRDFPGLVALQVVYEKHARDCTACSLHETRTNVVFGTGNSEEPDIAFLGEAPGEAEDLSGYPFTGKSGALIDRMIQAMGYAREDLYLLNTVGCRPPNNRNPTRVEMRACGPHVAAQLRAVKPKTIVCLGEVPAHDLLNLRDSVGEMRKDWYEWQGIPVRVTYHPAYLIRDPRMKTRVWHDLRKVLRKLGKPLPE